MKKDNLLLLVSFFLVMTTACSEVQPGKSSSTVYPPPGPISSPSFPTQGLSSPTTYPAPGSVGGGMPSIPYSGFEPHPSDDRFERSPVSFDLVESTVVLSADRPVEAKLILKGILPGPCHFLRVRVTPVDAYNSISLEGYSLVNPSRTCPNETQPFSVDIPLGSFPPGIYNVQINGERLGEFDTLDAPQPTGFEPQPGDDQLKRQPVSLDMLSSRLVVSGTKPVMVKAVLSGSLPSKCHSLRIAWNPPDAGGTLALEVYSLSDPSAICAAQAIPFTITIPLGSYSTGQYTVVSNALSTGFLGQFDASYAPHPEDDHFTRSEVTLDMASTQLATTGNYQFSYQQKWSIPAVNLQGLLPGSCHHLRILLSPDYDNHTVSLEIYSVYDPLAACTNAAQPFDVIYPLAGAYQSSVYVNDQFIGRFQWGG